MRSFVLLEKGSMISLWASSRGYRLKMNLESEKFLNPDQQNWLTIPTFFSVFHLKTTHERVRAGMKIESWRLKKFVLKVSCSTVFVCMTLCPPGTHFGHFYRPFSDVRRLFLFPGIRSLKESLRICLRSSRFAIGFQIEIVLLNRRGCLFSSSRTLTDTWNGWSVAWPF